MNETARVVGEDTYLGRQYGDSVLYVKAHTNNGERVHVGIQLLSAAQRKNVLVLRPEYMVAQVPSYSDFLDVRQVVSIVVADYELTKSDSYHSRFRFSTEDGVEFTDLVEMNIIELLKLPESSDGSDLWNWIKFIKSDCDVETLDLIAEKNPQIKKAVGILKELSADERTRMLYEDREKARRDEVAR